MTRLVAALLIALAAAPAAHSAPARPARPASRARTVTKPPAAADNPTQPPRPAGTRTLDAIHIEGELPLPQVMFITARDQRRFLEFEHHRYQRSTLELLRGTPLPNRVVVTSPPPQR
jgi:hypothetical protein